MLRCDRCVRLGGGAMIRRELRRIEDHRIRRGPRRIVAVLHPAVRRIDHLRQLIEGHDLGAGDEIGAIAGQHAVPKRVIAIRAHGRRGVVDVHDVPVAIGVHRVEDRQLLHPHRLPPFLEVARQPHPPELLEHPRPIRRDHAQRDGDAAVVGEHGTVDRCAGSVSGSSRSVPSAWRTLMICCSTSNDLVLPSSR